MALHMRSEADFYTEHLLDYPKDKYGSEEHRKFLHEFEYIQSNTREFGNRLAANPHFFDIMESWHVTLVGKESVEETSVKEAMKTDDVNKLMEQASNLATSVKDFVLSEGYVVTNISAGTDGWDIAIRCKEKESRVLCTDLQQRYARAIELELLAISRRFAGHCLPGLYNWDTAAAILKMYGDDLPVL